MRKHQHKTPVCDSKQRKPSKHKIARQNQNNGTQAALMRNHQHKTPVCDSKQRKPSKHKIARQNQNNGTQAALMRKHQHKTPQINEFVYSIVE